MAGDLVPLAKLARRAGGNDRPQQYLDVLKSLR
jgi:hypothetical protein